MNDTILKAIKETLPETQVKLIKDALIERDGLKEKAKELADDVKNLSKGLDKANSEVNKLMYERDALLTKNQGLEAHNDLLTKQGVRNEVDVIRAELTGVNATVDKFLKNIIYRESLQHQIADEYTSVQTQYINGQTVAVPTPGKTHRQVTDVKETTTE